MKKRIYSIGLVFGAIFPMVANYITNKKIQGKIDNAEDETIGVPNMRLLDLHKECLKQKNSLEDKAKVNVIGVTIAFSLMLNSTSFINSSFGKNVDQWVLILALVVIVLAAVYMIFAGILAIKVITDKNIVYEYSGECESEEECTKCREAIMKNRHMNTIRNNYVFSSYECIRNSLICFLFVFIVACITMIPSSNRIQNLNVSTNGNYKVYYAADSLIDDISDIGINEIQDSIISFIQNNNINQNQSFSFIDQDNNLFFKVERKNGELYEIDIEHYK